MVSIVSYIIYFLKVYVNSECFLNNTVCIMHHVSRKFSVSMTDLELPCRKTVNKSV